MKYAILNNEQTEIERVVDNPSTYKNTSFGVNSKEGDYLNAGLFKFLENRTYPQFFERQLKPTYNIDINNKMVTMVVAVEDMELDEVKSVLKNQNKERFQNESKRPRVDSLLGYFVDGSKEDRNNFEMTRSLMNEGETTIVKDADNNLQENVTKDDIEAIIIAISLSQKEILKDKWTRDAEIETCSTIEEIKAI